MNDTRLKTYYGQSIFGRVRVRKQKFGLYPPMNHRTPASLQAQKVPQSFFVDVANVGRVDLKKIHVSAHNFFLLTFE